MQALNIKNFGLKQIRMMQLCFKDKASEADTIEKLIVPVLSRLYGDSLYFERASRATRGERSKHWDLHYYHLEKDGIHKKDLIGVMECKATDKVLFNRVSSNGSWNYMAAVESVWNSYVSNGGKTHGTQAPTTVKSFVEKGFSSANADCLLQVWINARRLDGLKAKRILWSNGITWAVFKNGFFTSGGNPPLSMKLSKNNNGVSSNQYVDVVEFPKGTDADAIDAWLACYNALRKLLKL